MDLKQKLASLPHLRVTDLRQMYAEVFGEPTNANNRDWLTKRLAWRLQAQAMGGLSERAMARAKELAREEDLRVTPPPVATLPIPQQRDTRLPTPGAVITRTYKGVEHHVEVLADGFIWNGNTYTTLTAVAKAITGQHLNGFAFFGIKRGGKQ
ncbi:MAG: DUF2924 domain-containing protein [Planctomycetia bacterium]|nr:DUF2924 domain-containing protein [Planctomycetia bacterium]